MVFFITCLRAIAACLITNSHYTGVYPISEIASGGLIGDILFFAVSGYCLYNVKNNFFSWYGKRIWRIYLPVTIITAFYFLINAYNYNAYLPNAFSWFLYPTYYHFIASIILLYIPFYFVCKIDLLRKNIQWIMSGIFVLALIYFIFFYDKTYYHIDVVEEWFIRVLFFESMLLGALFRDADKTFRNNKKHLPLYIAGAVLSFAGYFLTKILCAGKEYLFNFQIINWITIFAFLFFVFKVFSSLDNKLEKLPKWIKKAISFVAEITLEIYLVQNVIISALDTRFAFPLNWFAVTAAILAGAFALHFICKYIYKFFDFLIATIKRKKVLKESQ